MINKTQTWQALEKKQQSLSQQTISDLFATQADRVQHFSAQGAGIYLDFSKSHLDQEALSLLIELAKQAQLPQFIKAMFNGEKINNTENRAVLHTALRNRSNTPVYVDDKDIMPAINASLEKMKGFCQQVQEQQWLGFSGKPITDIVNIGIGGSDLGPQLVVQALRHYRIKTLKCHFVANIDPTNLSEALEELNPETTLFIVASKTFTTEETLSSAKAAKQWLLNVTTDQTAIAKHFVAVSANPTKAIEFGIDENNVFAFWDWVGGRYSLWSAIGLPVALSLGFDNFIELLNGAHDLDQHFRQAPLEKNLPVLLALVGLWYRNFFNTSSHAIIPYAQSLSLLPNYLQQLDMESNGKQVTRDGEPVDYQTGPVIWGGCGTNGQHAFHQLLHQGTDLIPIDFILFKKTLTPINQQQTKLYANCLAQAEALLIGRQTEQSYRTMPGNKPSTIIATDKLTPNSLGSLIALYEHKVFVQGIIWQLNSFDQWGVELGKQLAKSLFNELTSTSSEKHDDSTITLIKRY